MSIAMNKLRRLRDKLLAESDWTQSRDVTLSNDADWKTYRQALRDLPSTASSDFINQVITATSAPVDMSSITFPTKPSQDKNMASILKTDKIEGVTASGTVAMPSGSVVQVVQREVANSFFSTTNNYS